jgi:hypothetical protein
VLLFICARWAFAEPLAFWALQLGSALQPMYGVMKEWIMPDVTPYSQLLIIVPAQYDHDDADPRPVTSVSVAHTRYTDLHRYTQSQSTMLAATQQLTPQQL